MSESLKVLQGGVLVGALDKGNSEPFYGFTYDGGLSEVVICCAAVPVAAAFSSSLHGL